MLSWGLPLMIVCFAMAFGALGLDQYSGLVGWCWIADKNEIAWPIFNEDDKAYTLFFWKMVAGKGIEIFTYIFTPFVYILSKRELDFENYDQRLLLNNSVRATLQDTDRKLVLIPIIFVGVRVWGSVRFLIAELLVNNILQVWWLALMQGVGDSAQGWANCILFCIFTRKIREKFVEYLPKCCWLCGRREDEASCEDLEKK